VAGNSETVAAVMRGVVHDINRCEANTEQDDDSKHCCEERIEFASLRDFGAKVGDGMILGVDGLRAHELFPLRGVGANAEF